MRTLICCLAAALALTGCGYKLGEIRPTPMRAVRTLAVPSFKNKTYEPRVEVLVADTLIKTLQEDGTYPVVATERADAILQGTITRVERRSIRSVQNNVLATAEFELVIEANYSVSDRLTGALLMEGRARGRTTFFSGNDLQTIERQAIPVAARDLAVQITTEIAEGW
ncbi:MAG: CsgG/HfaB family protein [Terrimicrobiaceae bacterium]|nr:CsgG/HfaB family protein [Terrimicrobiaceae bacterium]